MVVRALLRAFVIALVAACAPAHAAEVTLKVHHFLPPTSNTHAKFLEPWAKMIEADSQGRIAVEIYPSMQLGGRAPQLIDQVRDGVVDVVWTLPSYTSGRFPIASVFELPFMISNATATSQALQVFADKYLQEEFASVHPLVFHVHDRGVLHMKDNPVAEMSDLKGAKIRAPGRYIGEALSALGASPIFMPVPQVPEALSRGVIDGAALPYEIAEDLKIPELVDSHTEIKGPRGLYAAVFLLAMNKESYNNLPSDLQKVIDKHSGLAIAKWAGGIWDESEREGRKVAQQTDNVFNTIEGAEYERWREATRSVHEQWIADMEERGLDGEMLLEEAKRLIDKYTEAQ